MVEDRDSQRLTDVIEAVAPDEDPGDDDPRGMRVGPGTEVGGYVIDGELGHGGMGVVYSATHPVIGKRAAIKILRPEVSRSARTARPQLASTTLGIAPLPKPGSPAPRPRGPGGPGSSSSSGS